MFIRNEVFATCVIGVRPRSISSVALMLGLRMLMYPSYLSDNTSVSFPFMFAVSIAFAAPSEVPYLPFNFTLKVAITPSLPVNGESLSEKASACSVLPFIETPI